MTQKLVCRFQMYNPSMTEYLRVPCCGVWSGDNYNIQTVHQFYYEQSLTAQTDNCNDLPPSPHCNPLSLTLNI